MRVEETKRQRLNKLGAQLRTMRSSYESHWRELGEHFAPRRTRFFAQDNNRGDKRHQKIMNEVGILAARTLRSGMFAGITSPARPWRRLTTPDPDLAEYGKVKQWLAHVNRNMQTLDRKSNLYSALPTLFGDLGIFGTPAMAVMDDVDDGFRCYNFPIGSFWLATNQRNVVDTFMREFSLTVRQIVMMFGEETASGAPDWSRFSLSVKQAWEKGNYETPLIVTHVIYPNMEYDPKNLLDSKYKKFASCYFESQGSVNGGANGSFQAGEGAIFLRESGLDTFRILAPRWDVTGEDVYATSCPGMDALGTTKEIQLLEKRKSRAIEKQLNPALKGPPSLRNQKVSLIAGDLTLVDERDGKNGLSPIHEVNVNINDVTNDIQLKEDRVNRAFYVDMFLMLAQMEGIQPRNEKEIAERHEEKLLQLGPVLESVNESLEELTDIEFERMVVLGLVPEPPEEIQGQKLRVDFESIMAKAQKLVGVAGTERFFSFVGNLAAAFPKVLDKVDADEAVDEYGDMMGVSTNIIRTDEATQAFREQKAAEAQKQQVAAAVPELAKAASNLSNADLSTDNVLSRVLAGA